MKIKIEIGSQLDLFHIQVNPTGEMKKIKKNSKNTIKAHNHIETSNRVTEYFIKYSTER